MAQVCGLGDRRESVKHAEVQTILRVRERIDVDVSYVEGCKILEEMRSLARIYLEVRQRTLDDGLGQHIGELLPAAYLYPFIL